MLFPSSQPEIAHAFDDLLDVRLFKRLDVNVSFDVLLRHLQDGRNEVQNLMRAMSLIERKNKRENEGMKNEGMKKMKE